MKPLIQDQTVSFDTHQAGDGEAIRVHDLHMHKRMNNKRHRGVNIRIPLNPNREIDFEGNPDYEVQIMNEIKRVFKKDPNKVREMAQALADIIQRYGNEMTGEEKEEFLLGSARSIAKHFGLKPQVEDKLVSKVRGHIAFMLTTHEDDEGKLYYIKQDLLRERIKVGDNLEQIFYGNEKFN